MADSLPVLVRPAGAKGIFDNSDFELESIPIEKLRGALTELCSGVGQVLKDVKAVGEFRLTKVTVQVDISTEGSVSLIGIGGGKVGGGGGITLTFEV